MLDPRPVQLQIPQPRVTRIHLPGLSHLSTELWMGGAQSGSGDPLHPDDLAGAWVIDCAGDMPEQYRAAAAWWLTCSFQDYEELPSCWDRLSALARTLGCCLMGDLVEHAAEHPLEPPTRLYVVCNQGMNRSGLVVGRILRALGVTGEEALDVIRRHRPGAVNNVTFARLVCED